GELEEIAAGQQRRQVLLAVAAALEDLVALEREGRAHDGEEILGDLDAMIGAQRWAKAMVERLLDRGQAMPHRHVDMGAERDAPAGILDQPPGRIVEPEAMNVFVARAQ